MCRSGIGDIHSLQRHSGSGECTEIDHQFFIFISEEIIEIIESEITGISSNKFRHIFRQRTHGVKEIAPCHLTDSGAAMIIQIPAAGIIILTHFFIRNDRVVNRKSVPVCFRRDLCCKDDFIFQFGKQCVDRFFQFGGNLEGQCFFQNGNQVGEGADIVTVVECRSEGSTNRRPISISKFKAVACKFVQCGGKSGTAGIECRKCQIFSAGTVARFHDLFRKFQRRHICFQTVEQHFIHHQQVRCPADRFRSDRVIHHSFQFGNDHIAAHKTLVESNNRKIIIFILTEQIGDLINGEHTVACFIGAVIPE